MPDIKLPDGKKIPFLKTIDGFEIAKKIYLKVIIKKSLSEINHLLISNHNKYILVTGSLYLVGKIRKKYL